MSRYCLDTSAYSHFRRGDEVSSRSWTERSGWGFLPSRWVSSEQVFSWEVTGFATSPNSASSWRTPWWRSWWWTRRSAATTRKSWRISGGSALLSDQ